MLLVGKQNVVSLAYLSYLLPRIENNFLVSTMEGHDPSIEIVASQVLLKSSKHQVSDMFCRQMSIPALAQKWDTFITSCDLCAGRQLKRCHVRILHPQNLVQEFDYEIIKSGQSRIGLVGTPLFHVIQNDTCNYVIRLYLIIKRGSEMINEEFRSRSKYLKSSMARIGLLS